MAIRLHLAHFTCAILSASACLQAQVAVAGRVVDETGAGIEDAPVEFRPAEGRGRSFVDYVPICNLAKGLEY
jgi:protocatechuate 3,4-dioxygenase beta subunit